MKFNFTEQELSKKININDLFDQYAKQVGVDEEHSHAVNELKGIVGMMSLFCEELPVEIFLNGWKDTSEKEKRYLENSIKILLNKKQEPNTQKCYCPGCQAIDRINELKRIEEKQEEEMRNKNILLQLTNTPLDSLEGNTYEEKLNLFCRKEYNKNLDTIVNVRMFIKTSINIFDSIITEQLTKRLTHKENIKVNDLIKILKESIIEREKEIDSESEINNQEVEEIAILIIVMHLLSK